MICMSGFKHFLVASSLNELVVYLVTCRKVFIPLMFIILFVMGL